MSMNVHCQYIADVTTKANVQKEASKPTESSAMRAICDLAHALRVICPRHIFVFGCGFAALCYRRYLPFKNSLHSVSWGVHQPGVMFLSPGRKI
jgi:hypothetical protein